MSSAKPGSNIVLGAGFTIAASLAVALMAAIIKWSSVAVSTELLMTLRWATGLLIFFMLLVIFRPRLELKTERPVAQLLSAVCWTGSIYCYYLSLQWIPMLDATLLLNTGSLFAPAIARILAGERQTRLAWLANGVGFVGIVVVLQPHAGSFNPASALALASGLLMAFRLYFNRQLGGSEPIERTAFYSITFGLPICLGAFAIAGFPIHNWTGHMFTPTEKLIPWLTDGLMVAATLILGGLAIAQTGLSAASLRSANIGQIAPFRYFAVIFTALLDYLIWEHIPTKSSWLGFGIIFLSAMALLRIPKLNPNSVETDS
ncbi:MAG: DMT family transporter [Gammaproteobacteria bacterium]|nr:DMT family transporter [Gammaproteobacteria bacterium]